MMLSDVFDEQEMVELQGLITGASASDLDLMKRNLRQVMRMIERELPNRGFINDTSVEVQVVSVSKPVVTQAKPVSRGGKVKRVCDNKGCGVVYEARQADLKRGWGMCCSKSCAASHKLRGNPNHGYLRGTVRDERYLSEDEIRERNHQAALDDCGQGWDGHKDSF